MYRPYRRPWTIDPLACPSRRSIPPPLVEIAFFVLTCSVGVLVYAALSVLNELVRRYLPACTSEHYYVITSRVGLCCAAPQSAVPREGVAPPLPDHVLT
eukprot:592625-Prorocentrum_minimum.AAC.1